MQFPALCHGILLCRYKRFLADVQLPNGEQITLHCPNTGAMTGCANVGDRVWFSTSDNPKRKYAYTWELTETQTGDFICINTQRANQLVAEALAKKSIPELAVFDKVFPEQKYGEENSRIDFLLKNDALEGNAASCYLEVKSTTLLIENGLGMFPDAKTERGQKHLRELTYLVQQGYQSVLFFAALHTGIDQFAVAEQIDPIYARLFKQAKKQGVQTLCYKITMEFADNRPTGMRLTSKLA
ncbi:sugar fermentation stimulation protein A [Nicoletella semolina]|uniref:Sugar fermentation stimulation protein homolog n=1 Tax=Nicoletella semolina TaxID=271160 RepID=A0A4R2N7V0_9PAST|nr:DNA/RNA nuclease SfsA [Nicoletella semolina]MDH2924593.1 sugar fermentation stimulation protein SfsA [Nicoletella semolina]TCP16958.1 sugar fermentation stimulation protein A [Nicoletella semolina]